MTKLFSIAMVGLLLFAGSVQGVSAVEICSTQIISCVSATETSYRGMGDLATTEAAAAAMARRRATEAYAARYAGLAEAEAATFRRAAVADAARYTGLAAYYSGRAAWGPRADAARYQALADHYARLTWDATTLAHTRGVAGLYSR